MSYKITIEETTNKIETTGKDWVIIGQEQKKGAFDDEVYLSEERGYSPEIEKRVSRTMTIFEQTVEDLRVTDVIMAINGEAE